MSTATTFRYSSDVSIRPFQILESRLYLRWRYGFEEGWQIETIDIKAALARDGVPFMLVMNVTATDPHNQRHSALIMLRGTTVDVLTILTDGREDYVLFVEQARLPAGGMVLSNPSGMVEDDGDIAATASRELLEEVGDVAVWSPPVWLGRELVGGTDPFLVSPGGSNEDAAFCVVKATLPTEQLQALHSRTAGLAAEGESTKAHIVKLSEAFRYLGRRGHPDLKAVTALLLYAASQE